MGENDVADLERTNRSSQGDRKRFRILFVCSGNTCRSVLAEYIARFRFGEQVESESVGIRPQTAADASSAIATLKEIGIDASCHQPRGLENVNPESFDLVITMEPFVAKRFSERFPKYSTEKITKWKINDPYGDNPAEYKVCAIKIHAQLRTFLRTLT